MMGYKKRIWMLVPLALLMAGTIFGFTVAPRPVRGASEGIGAAGKAHDALIDKAGRDGRVRVIVELNASFVPEGELAGFQPVFDQRVDIRRSQDFLVASLENFHIDSVQRFQFIPYLALEVDPQALAFLLSSPLVSGIEEDEPVPPSLDLSIPLINADDVWAAGFTGVSQTIAILDTGVDTTHAFLGGRVVSEACYSTTGSDSTTLCPNGQASQTGPGAGVNCDAAIRSCPHGTHVAGIAAGHGPDFSGMDTNTKSQTQFFSSLHHVRSTAQSATGGWKNS